jgi:transcriptional regulator with XRE-family HTH domain
VKQAERARPGAYLRAIRQQRGWTLAEVAGRTDIPVSTLSKIELDQLSLTYDQIMRLSEELQIDVSEIFRGRGAQIQNPIGRRSINLAGSGEVIEAGNSTLVYLSTDLLEKKFSPIMSELRARTMQEFGDFSRHPGDEFCVVLEGEMEFHCEIYAPVVLKAGESIYFDSAMGHAYLARGEGPCRIVSVCSAPRSAEEVEAPPPRAKPAKAAQPAARPRGRPAKTGK